MVVELKSKTLKTGVLFVLGLRPTGSTMNKAQSVVLHPYQWVLFLHLAKLDSIIAIMNAISTW